MYKLDIQKLITEVKSGKGVSALKAELEKIRKELKTQVQPQAEAEYKKIVGKLTKAQKDLDKEIHQKLTVLKTQAKQAEKQINKYKKLALTEKARIKAAFTKKKAGPARKKTSRKVARKTSRKVATA